MNVTLIYPALRLSGGFDSLGRNDNQGSTYESLYINHGLPQLAACLEQEGHRVNVLDLRDLKSWVDFEDKIKNSTTRTYGITISTIDYNEAVKAAQIIKKIKPHALVVVGGPHPSVCPEQLSTVPYFDKIIVGEGEITLPQLIQNPDQCPKVIRGEKPIPDNLPYEDREVFNLKRIFSTNYTGHPTVVMPFVNVISGRGCLFRCKLCKPCEDIIFGKLRMRSLNHFFGEIQTLNDKYRFGTLAIDDDSFTLYPNYTQAFCELYEKKIHKPFFFQSRVDFICKNPDIMKMLKQAGAERVWIGLESGNQRILDLMQKDTTVEQNYKAVEICKEVGVKVWANFVVGFPTETKREMEDTFNMIKKMRPDHPSGAVFTPIVGTYLYEYCKEQKILLSEAPEVIGSRNPGEPKIKGIDYKWIVEQLYPHQKSRLWRRTAKKVLQKIRVNPKNQ